MNDIIEMFISKYGYIAYDYGMITFLNFLQLEMLKNKENDFTNDIDVEDFIRTAYQTMTDLESVEEFLDDDLKERECLVEDARKCIRRLNNEELRNIIFHHPLRDIVDDEMSDEDITKDNLVKEKFDSNLAIKIVEQEKAKKEIRSMTSKAITEKINQILDAYGLKYFIEHNENEIHIMYDL